jgi:pSer/pThr/pTyr-binding forkhead associated (FHA) protein
VEEQLGIDPVVGWLVCVEGPERGRDYRIRSENNFIGRDKTNHIAVAADDTISRQKHATVAFEPNERAFWLMPGAGSGLTYVNGKMIMAPAQLAPRDVIRLGKTSLMLVPLVDSSFSWQ